MSYNLNQDLFTLQPFFLAQTRLQLGGIRELGEWLQNKEEWNMFLSNLLKL